MMSQHIPLCTRRWYAQLPSVCKAGANWLESDEARRITSWAISPEYQAGITTCIKSLSAVVHHAKDLHCYKLCNYNVIRQRCACFCSVSSFTIMAVSMYSKTAVASAVTFRALTSAWRLTSGQGKHDLVQHRSVHEKCCTGHCTGHWTGHHTGCCTGVAQVIAQVRCVKAHVQVYVMHKPHCEQTCWSAASCCMRWATMRASFSLMDPLFLRESCRAFAACGPRPWG